MAPRKATEDAQDGVAGHTLVSAIRRDGIRSGSRVYTSDTTDATHWAASVHCSVEMKGRNIKNRLQAGNGGGACMSYYLSRRQTSPQKRRTPTPTPHLLDVTKGVGADRCQVFKGGLAECAV